MHLIKIFGKYLLVVSLALLLLWYKLHLSDIRFLNQSYYEFQASTFYKPIFVTSQVVGVVKKINFQKGQTVDTNDLLVELANNEYKDTLEKYSLNKSIPQDVINNLQTNIDNLNIYSKVTGSVTEVNVILDEKIYPSQRIMTVADFNTYGYILKFTYPEYNSQTIDFKSNLQIGSPVLIVYYDGKKSIKGVVTDMENQKDKSVYSAVYIKPLENVSFNPNEKVVIRIHKNTLFDNFSSLFNLF